MKPRSRSAVFLFGGMLLVATVSVAFADTSATPVPEWQQLGFTAALEDPNLETLLAAISTDVLDRDAALQAAAQLGAKEQAVPALLTLLNDPNSDRDLRGRAANALARLRPLTLDQSVRILERSYGHEDEIGERRFYAHLLGGGDPRIEVAIGCLGKNDDKSLTALNSAWATSACPHLHKDVADKIAELATYGGWQPLEIAKLLKLRVQFAAEGTAYAADASQISIALAENKIWKWGLGSVEFLLVQASFWVVMIFAYPRSVQVQAILFWNPWVRKILGSAT